MMRRNFLVATSRVKSSAPQLSNLLKDDKISDSEVATRIKGIQDVLLSKLSHPSFMLEVLNLCSQNLHLITLKWSKSQDFAKILVAIPWRDVVFKDEHGPGIVSALLDILNVIVATSPNTLQSILAGIMLKIFLGDPQCSADEKITKLEGPVFNKVHSFIQEAADSYPHGSRIIAVSIKNAFPHHQTATGHSFIAYIYNSLVTLEYLLDPFPTLARVADKLIWLEMSSQVDQKLNSNIGPNHIEQAQKFFTLFDQAFELFLDTIYDMLHPEGRLIASGDVERSKKFLDALENVFFKQIAPVDTLVNLPFCAIYWASFTPEMCTRLVDGIWNQILSADNKSGARFAFFLSSMLVEVSYITPEHVMTFIESATSWALEYSQCFPSEIVYDNFIPKIHSKFYAVTQSIFYVMSCKINCFNETQLKTLRFLKIQKLIQCNLNPLLFCLPTIVDEFAEISKYHQIALCSVVLERNKRLNYDQTPFFNQSLYHYFPFHDHTFQLADQRFDAVFECQME